MKITVMGPGGVGGYFGARLAAAGNDVTFVARGSHLEAMRRGGLRLDSELGALHLNPVQVVADAREIAAADAIMFAVKMRDTESAAASLKPLVAKGAAVFTFQNGVESAERVGKVVGAGNVVPGVARIGSHISEPGVIKQTGKFCQPRVRRSRRQAERPRRRRSLEACKRAGFEAVIPQNIGREVWMKFAMLAPLSGMTALTRGPIGPIRANAQSRALLEAAVKETVAVGVALKTGLTPADERRPAEADRRFPGEPDGVDGARPAGGQADRARRPVGRRGAARQGCGVPAPTHTFIAQALAPFIDGKP